MSGLFQMLTELRADLLPPVDKWVDTRGSNITTAAQLFGFIRARGGMARGHEIGAVFGFTDKDVKRLLARMVKRGRLTKTGANEMRAEYRVSKKYS